MTKLTIRFSHALPREENLAWLIGDFEYRGMSNVEWAEKVLGHRLYNNDGTLMNGLPCPVKFYNQRAADISPGSPCWTLFMENFSRYAPAWMSWGEVEKNARGVMKQGTCFTDFDAYRMNPIMTAMNPVYVMGDPQNMGGGVWTPVRMLRVGSYDSMKAQLIKYPLLSFNATISNRYNGGRGVDPFWHLGGRDCKVINFCDDKGLDYDRWYHGEQREDSAINWLPTERLIPIRKWEHIPNSYYPART